MKRRFFLQTLAAVSAALLVPVQAVQAKLKRLRAPAPPRWTRQEGQIRVLRAAYGQPTLVTDDYFEAAIRDAGDPDDLLGEAPPPDSEPELKLTDDGATLWGHRDESGKWWGEDTRRRARSHGLNPDREVTLYYPTSPQLPDARERYLGRYTLKKPTQDES